MFNKPVLNYIKSKEAHFTLMFLASVVLAVWQNSGMNIQLELLPDESIAQTAIPHSDLINGGHSKTYLEDKEGEINLKCKIIRSETFAFCGVTIFFDKNATKRVNLYQYDRMSISFDYHSLENDTILIYLNHQALDANGNPVMKSNLWAVNPETGPNRFILEPDRFIIPSWWIFQNSHTGIDLKPDISNVDSITITTGDNTTNRDVNLTIKGISFSGKRISSHHLYTALLTAWLSLFFIHGLLYFHQQARNYQISKKQNEKLTKLNDFLKIQKDQFENMAKKDKLTDTWNRAGIRDTLNSVMNDFHTRQAPCALLFIDIDHFKQVNDRYSHSVGDKALAGLAKLIRKNTRKVNQLARWGGEEFVLICPYTDADAAKHLSETLRHIIETSTIIKETKITCSFGIAIVKNESIEQWFDRADKALYEAKSSGRNCVILAD